MSNPGRSSTITSSVEDKLCDLDGIVERIPIIVWVLVPTIFPLLLSFIVDQIFVPFIVLASAVASFYVQKRAFYRVQRLAPVECIIKVALPFYSFFLIWALSLVIQNRIEFIGYLLAPSLFLSLSGIKPIYRKREVIKKGIKDRSFLVFFSIALFLIAIQQIMMIWRLIV